MFESASPILWVIGFLLVLGPLVTVHEFGHYLVGRWFGVKADIFSIGFGKELLGRTDRRGTRWRLSAIPLGGYVQFSGDMNPASKPSEAWLAMPEEERNRTFQSKSLWQRTLIVAAGPATNFIVAILIFAAFNLAYGKIDGPPVVDHFSDDSPALQAGMQAGDKILRVDGDAIGNHGDLVDHFALFPGKTVTIEFERNGRMMSLPIEVQGVIEADEFGNESRVGRIGVYSAVPEAVPVGPVEAVALATGQTVGVVRMIMTSVGQIISRQRSVRELGGPIKIAKYSGEQLVRGPEAFVFFVAMISINLAFINLLPIPALDGGHLAFYAAEAVRRKPVGPRSQEWAFRTGVAFVLALMLFVTINDIASLPIFGN